MQRKPLQLEKYTNYTARYIIHETTNSLSYSLKKIRRCPFFSAPNFPLNFQQFPSDPSVLTRDEDHEAKELQLTAIGPLFSEGRRGIDLVVDEQAHAPNDHGPDHQKGHWSLVPESCPKLTHQGFLDVRLKSIHCHSLL